MNTYKFSDIEVGLEESFEVTIDVSKMDKFLDISNDINPLHIAYLGGWSGSSLNLNEIMVNYGKAGMEAPEMLFKLQSVMKSINSHLLETEPSKNNVVELRA